MGFFLVLILVECRILFNFLYYFKRFFVLKGWFNIVCLRDSFEELFVEVISLLKMVKILIVYLCSNGYFLMMIFFKLFFGRVLICSNCYNCCLIIFGRFFLLFIFINVWIVVNIWNFLVVCIFFLCFGIRSFLCLIRGSSVFIILVGVWFRFLIKIYFFFLIVVVKIFGCYEKELGFLFVVYKLRSILVFVCLFRCSVIILFCFFNFFVIFWINDVLFVLDRLWSKMGFGFCKSLLRFLRFFIVVEVSVRVFGVFIGLRGCGRIVLLYVIIRGVRFWIIGVIGFFCCCCCLVWILLWRCWIFWFFVFLYRFRNE